MFERFTHRRRMTGGLYFGPPGWSADHLEGGTSPGLPHARETPRENEARSAQPIDSPAALAALLDAARINRTSPITPPLADQVKDLPPRAPRAVVLNLLPAQPESALPAAMVRLFPEAILRGLVAIHEALKPRRTIVLIDRHDHRTRRAWRRAVRKHPVARRFQVARLLNKYPQAHPTILLRSLFNIRLPVGKLPSRVNRVLVDPVAAWALGEHLQTGEPFSRRPLQLFAPAPGCPAPTPRLVMATIGEPLDSFCDDYKTRPSGMQVIANGLLAGEEVDEATFTIARHTESITIRERPLPEQPSPCFSCGWCLDVCPTALNPVNLLDIAERASAGLGGPDPAAINSAVRSPDARESLHCIGCGLCSYVCPTRLPLTQQTLRLRNWILQAKG